MDKQAATTVSVFGAALTTAMIAPELQADIVSLSFNPTSVPTQATSVAVNVDIMAGTVLVGSFNQWNDFIGQTLYAIGGGLAGIDFVSASQTLSPGTFAPPYTAANLSFYGPGTHYIGFTTTAGNVGWFSYNTGGSLTTITYLEGAYGSMGEAVHVGTIPAPGALALLALGAAGVRRSRKRAA